MVDLVIVGGGPAGVAAGVYAARKRLKTVLIAEEIGGQSIVSSGIENWIGMREISGVELAKSFQTHLDAIKGDAVTLAVGETVVMLEKGAEGFSVKTKTAKEFSAKAVLVATGASRRKLNVPGAEKFENKGVTYCASCDGPLFADQDVAVIGGGNAGFETALQLLAYAKSVTLIHRHKEFKADPITVEKASAHLNMRIITHAEPTEVMGEQFVTGLKYENKDSGTVEDLAVAGIFVEAGVIPNTEFAKGLVEFDPIRRIKTDPRSQRTSHEGVWAAGDCTDELYHQNNIAAGDGVKALEDIYLWIKKR
ncbi:FAD-dependent oxidoreductase [Patescibacteria group bacterium]|nr:FAD-dependent oxidoreductase [Patescibacteria group bacterium]MDE2173198.1 FAD-dependent oxidoreductase [Patescibacteria group bacterium]